MCLNEVRENYGRGYEIQRRAGNEETLAEKVDRIVLRWYTLYTY